MLPRVEFGLRQPCIQRYIRNHSITQLAASIHDDISLQDTSYITIHLRVVKVPKSCQANEYKPFDPCSRLTTRMVSRYLALLIHLYFKPASLEAIRLSSSRLTAKCGNSFQHRGPEAGNCISRSSGTWCQRAV